MADLSGVRLEGTGVGSNGAGNGVKTTETRPQDGKTKEFKRNIFLKTTSTRDTEIRPDEKGRPMENEAPSEWVKMTPELRNQYRRFLSDHGRSLYELKKRDPAILENDNHIHDNELLKLLTDEKTGELLSDEKIDAFLDKPEGWMITTMAMEHVAALRLFALGLQAEYLPPGQRNETADPMVIRLGIDQGTLNKFYQDRVVPNLGRIGRATAFAASMSGLPALGWAVNDLGGAIAGAVLSPTFYVVNRLIRSLTSDGVRIDLRQCAAAFEVVSGDPNEAAYMAEMTGVNVRDFRRDGNRIVRINGNRSESTANVQTQESEILQSIYTREQFYTSLGIPRKSLDALPEQSLLNSSGGQPEETGARWEADVQARFNDLGGPMAGNIRGNIERYMDARREVMMEMVNNYQVREKLQKSTDRPVRVLADKEKDFAPDGKYVKKRRERIQGEITVLGKDKTGLTTEQADLKAYQDAQASLENVRRELRSEYGVDDSLKIDTEINNRKNRLGGTGLVPLAGSIAEKRDRLDAEQGNAENAARIAIPTSLSGRPADSWLETRLRPIQTGYNRQRTALDAEEQKLNEEISKLQVSKKKILDEEAKLKGTETTQKAEKLVSTLIKDYEDIRSWDALVGGVSLTETDLKTQSFEEIIRRINQVHTARAGTVNPEGWPESQNSREELRLKVLNAMAEARAREISSSIGAPTPDFTTVTNPAIYNISENDLRASTDTEIHSLIAGIAPLTIDVVRNAIKEARGRLDARSQALNERVGQVGEKVKQQEAILGTVDNSFSNEAAQISVARDVLTRYGEIASSGFHVANERKKYTETSAVNAADASYTQAEKDAGGPKGYYELMDLMFDYKERPDKDEYFRKISRALPPQKFAGLLNEILELSVAVPATGINVNDVLTELDDRIKVGRISQLDTSYAFRQIIERLKAEALSLAA